MEFRATTSERVQPCSGEFVDDGDDGSSCGDVCCVRMKGGVAVYSVYKPPRTALVLLFPFLRPVCWRCCTPMDRAHIACAPSGHAEMFLCTNLKCLAHDDTAPVVVDIDIGGPTVRCATQFLLRASVALLE